MSQTCRVTVDTAYGMFMVHVFWGRGKVVVWSEHTYHTFQAYGVYAAVAYAVRRSAYLLIRDVKGGWFRRR